MVVSTSAIAYSILETAKANGIDSNNYLLHVLSVLPYCGKAVSHELLETHMPWGDAVQKRYGATAKATVE